MNTLSEELKSMLDCDAEATGTGQVPLLPFLSANVRNSTSECL